MTKIRKNRFSRFQNQKRKRVALLVLSLHFAGCNEKLMLYLNIAIDKHTNWKICLKKSKATTYIYCKALFWFALQLGCSITHTVISARVLCPYRVHELAGLGSSSSELATSKVNAMLLSYTSQSTFCKL